MAESGSLFTVLFENGDRQIGNDSCTISRSRFAWHPCSPAIGPALLASVRDAVW